MFDGALASLRLRLPVGLAIGVAVTAVIVLLDTDLVASIFATIALLICWEWGCLNENSLFKAALHPLLLALVLLYMTVQPSSQLIGIFLYLALGWWAVMFIIITAYQESWRDTIWLVWLFRIGSIIVIPAVWLSIVLLHQANIYDLLYLIGLVAVVDIAAYIAGNLWGQRKLIPEISPGKTYAGLWGAMVGALILSIIIAIVSYSSWVEGMNFVLLSILIALVAIIGDLSESLLKRRAGVKDSGFILPGHGGLFDRTDSLLAAAPVFVLIQY